MASCPPVYAWAENIQHMDPCEVASSLMNVCDSTLPPLPPIINPEDTYPGPTKENQSSCVCSSVIYALVSACSHCQGGQIESWPTWSANCVSPLVDSFEGPLPANISVPTWAHFDVNSYPTYSPRSVASSSAVALQAIPKITGTNATAAAQMLPTTTSTFTFQTTPTNTSTGTETTASFGPDDSPDDLSSAALADRTAAIAGGTIGAVVLLAIGAALAYWYMRRRRRTRVPPSVAYMAVHELGSSNY